jgi:hypothetical protein
MERIKKTIEKNKIQKMIKSKKYIVINSGYELIGLMNRKTNKIYKPKCELFVEA